MKHLFIINPAAGKGRALKLIPDIVELFSQRGDDYFISITEYPGHATSIVKEYVGLDTYRVYSVGGDGTLNEVLNGMAGSTSSLAVIPCGSGNDFIRSLANIKEDFDLLPLMADGIEKPTDLARVNGKYFINISSLGFDSDVVFNTVRFKKLPWISGSLAYIMGVVTTLLSCKSYDLEILIDDKGISLKSLLIAVANGKYYGGGMMPAPQAELDDGLLDICLIKEKSILEILRFFPSFIKGKHTGIEGVNLYKGRKITVKSGSDIILNVDGEIQKVREAVFEVIPGGVNIVYPNCQKENIETSQKQAVFRKQDTFFY